MIDNQKRRLFASVSTLFKENKKNIITPPYNKNQAMFFELCPKCIDKSCSKMCEEKIIFINENGIPTLNFKDRGCTFCGICADVCEFNVLDDKKQTSINATVEIDLLKCIAWHQVMCSSCKEPCLEDAIVFLGLFKPEIDKNRCTSCGWCISVCPTKAINIKSMNSNL